jgi:hypothetical protein
MSRSTSGAPSSISRSMANGVRAKARMDPPFVRASLEQQIEHVAPPRLDRDDERETSEG